MKCRIFFKMQLSKLVSKSTNFAPFFGFAALTQVGLSVGPWGACTCACIFDLQASRFCVVCWVHVGGIVHECCYPTLFCLAHSIQYVIKVRLSSWSIDWRINGTFWSFNREGQNVCRAVSHPVMKLSSILSQSFACHHCAGCHLMGVCSMTNFNYNTGQFNKSIVKIVCINWWHLL